MPDHSIIVRLAPDGAGFDCLIRPAPAWQPLDRESMPTYRAARRAADHLHIVHKDWPVIDEVPTDRKERAK